MRLYLSVWLINFGVTCPYSYSVCSVHSQFAVSFYFTPTEKKSCLIWYILSSSIDISMNNTNISFNNSLQMQMKLKHWICPRIYAQHVNVQNSKWFNPIQLKLLENISDFQKYTTCVFKPVLSFEYCTSTEVNDPPLSKINMLQ